MDPETPKTEATCERPKEDGSLCGGPARYSFSGMPLCEDCANDAVTGGDAFPGIDLFDWPDEG